MDLLKARLSALEKQNMDLQASILDQSQVHSNLAKEKREKKALAKKVRDLVSDIRDLEKRQSTSTGGLTRTCTALYKQVKALEKELKAREEELKAYNVNIEDEDDVEYTTRPRKPLMTEDEYVVEIDEILKRFMGESMQEEEALKALNDLCLH